MYLNGPLFTGFRPKIWWVTKGSSCPSFFWIFNIYALNRFATFCFLFGYFESEKTSFVYKPHAFELFSTYIFPTFHENSILIYYLKKPFFYPWAGWTFPSCFHEKEQFLQSECIFFKTGVDLLITPMRRNELVMMPVVDEGVVSAFETVDILLLQQLSHALLDHLVWEQTHVQTFKATRFAFYSSDYVQTRLLPFPAF